MALEQLPCDGRHHVRTPFLHTDTILSPFATKRRLAQHAYRRFVEAGIDAALTDEARGERIGSDPFLRTTFGHDPPIAEIPRAQIEPLPPDLNEIFKTSANPVATAYRRHGYTLRQIGEHLGCHYSTISHDSDAKKTKTAA